MIYPRLSPRRETDVVSAVYTRSKTRKGLAGVDMDAKVRELAAICLIAFVGLGLAWAHDADFFAAVFAVAAAIAGVEALQRSL